MTTQENQTQAQVSDLVTVINRSSSVEILMDQLISQFCSPRPEAAIFMNAVILDSTVMSLGAKAKVIAAIAYTLDVKFDRNPLLRLIAIRNAFAHNPTDAHTVISYQERETTATFYHEFWTLGTSGEIVKEKRKNAFLEFNEKYGAVRNSLNELLQAVAVNLETRGQIKSPFKTPKMAKELKK